VQTGAPSALELGVDRGVHRLAAAYSSDAAVGFGLVVGKALVRSNDHARHSAEEGQATAERNTKKRHAATSFVASAASDRATLG
jgi:hypothetical protein